MVFRMRGDAASRFLAIATSLNLKQTFGVKMVLLGFVACQLKIAGLLYSLLFDDNSLLWTPDGNQIDLSMVNESPGRSYNSSLRYDWSNLPPMTPLGKILERSLSQCMNESFVQHHGPQELVYFNMIPSGMASSLHTWMNPLCHASATGKVLITGQQDKFRQEWLWNDELSCALEFEKQKHASMGYEFQRKGSYSALDCYFGKHVSTLRCPPGTVAWDKPIVNHNSVWQRYGCNEYHLKYGRSGVLSAVAEWLFQNVSQLVIQEAERQIREEAFPATSDSTLDNHNHNHQEHQQELGFGHWRELPDPDSLITVHIRWGDKQREMELVTLEEVINGTKQLLTEEELNGTKAIHIYVATEDPQAVEQFRDAAAPNWRIHASGPKNPLTATEGEEVRMMDVAYESKGQAGLQSLGALLISLEANRYVLMTQSNWSRLINELRKSIVNSRCGNCTKMVDLRYGEL